MTIERTAALYTARLLVASLMLTLMGAHQVKPIPAGQRAPANLTSGRALFISRCAGCHGLDGKGGEHAPNIATNPAVQNLTDGRLTEIIRNGVAEKGMPAFESLGQAQIGAVVQYLRVLGGQLTALPPGDANHGREIFFGKAGCGKCHSIDGAGGFIASDLSGYLRTHTPEELKAAILDGGSSEQKGGRLLTIRLRSGEQVTGLLRNEDNFSMQLIDENGNFHLLTKSEIASITAARQPLMPSDYRARLSANEVDDLVRFVASVGRDK